MIKNTIKIFLVVHLSRSNIGIHVTENTSMKIMTTQPLMSDRSQITRQIANFWDKITEGWRAIWGPHIHHGYYESNASLTPLEAQEKLIEKLTEMLEITPEK